MLTNISLMIQVAPDVCFEVVEQDVMDDSQLAAKELALFFKFFILLLKYGIFFAAFDCRGTSER